MGIPVPKDGMWELVKPAQPIVCPDGKVRGPGEPFHATRAFLVKHSALRRLRRLVPSEAKPAAASDSVSTPSLEDTVRAALADGKKPKLIEALDLVGLNPDDFSNNGERLQALEEWLG